MRKVLALSFFLLVACSLCAAQDRADNCPTISVDGPAGIVALGETATYTAMVNVAENQKQNLEYLWSTNTGEIVSGQGSASIEVRHRGQSLTATVEVKGLPAVCPNTASAAYSDSGGFPIPAKVGQFDGAGFSGDKIELSGVVQSMNDNPNNQLYIYFLYEKEPANEAFLRTEREVIDYLAVTIGGRERITSVRSVAGVNRVHFWRVPPGANNPICEECESSCPTISITGPAGITVPGDSMLFTATVSDQPSSSSKYHWTLADDGKILSGQGTPSLLVQTPKKSSFNITATVEVSGLPPGCANAASITAPVACDCGEPLLVDEFQRLSLREQMARIENAVHELRQRSKSKLHFIYYFPNNASRPTINNKVSWLTGQLARRHKLPSTEFEIVTSQSFDGVPRTKIYIVFPGTTNPAP